MVLASCSPYFYAMFTGFDFEESHQEKITVQGVDYHALQLLVEYVYTSIVEVTEDNVQVGLTLNLPTLYFFCHNNSYTQFKIFQHISGSFDSCKSSSIN